MKLHQLAVAVLVIASANSALNASDKAEFYAEEYMHQQDMRQAKGARSSSYSPLLPDPKAFSNKQEIARGASASQKHVVHSPSKRPQGSTPTNSPVKRPAKK